MSAEAMQKVYKIKIEYVSGWTESGHTYRDAEIRGGVVIGWSAEDIGFGQLTFKMVEGGKIEMETEHMNDGFVKAILIALFEQSTRVE